MLFLGCFYILGLNRSKVERLITYVGYSVWNVLYRSLSGWSRTFLSLRSLLILFEVCKVVDTPGLFNNSVIRVTFSSDVATERLFLSSRNRVWLTEPFLIPKQVEMLFTCVFFFWKLTHFSGYLLFHSWVLLKNNSNKCGSMSDCFCFLGFTMQSSFL